MLSQRPTLPATLISARVARSGSLRANLLGSCAAAALLALPAMVTLGVALPTPARAQVVATPPTYDNPSSSSVGYVHYGTVTFTNEGTISGTGAFGGAIYLGTNSTLTNTGTIVGTGNFGAVMDGGTLVNNAGGTITGLATGASIVGFAGTVSNTNGTIIGTSGNGVYLSQGGYVTNAGTGLIQGGTNGVIMNEPGTAYNSGTIIGTSGIGVALYVGGSFTNSNTGRVSGGTSGVVINHFGAIYNSGSIIGTTGNGAFLGEGGTVSNGANGLISGGTNGIYFQYNDAGTITNSGTITGTGSTGAGVLFGTGGTVTNVTASSVISGGAYGVLGGLRGGQVTVVNAGTIIGTLSQGVQLDAGGSITNSGSASLIQGGYSGIAVHNASASVYNRGTIKGATGYGVSLYTGSVTNRLTTSVISGGVSGIAATGGAGAYGTVVNYGTITGGTHSGVYLYSGLVSNANGAGITGAINGVSIYQSGATVINAGTITGTTGSGVYLHNGGLVSNTGTIIGTGTAGVGVLLGGGGSVTNSGTGLIQGGSFGVEFTNGGTLDNTGTIVGNSGTAVRFGSGTNLLIDETTGVFQGAIVGGTGVNIVELLSSGALALPTSVGGGTLLNFNVLGAAAGVTLTNSGSFTGSVELMGASASVVNSAGAQIISTLATPAAVYGNLTNLTVTNAGTITDTTTGDAGVFISGGSVTNVGTSSLIAGNGFGVKISHSGSVANAGSITASSGTGVYLYAGSVANSTVTSLISGTAYGVNIHSGSVANSVSNFGTIKSGTAGIGVYLYKGSVTNVGTSSLISGGQFGVEIAQHAAGTITNAGTIAATGTAGVGVKLRDGGTATNSGTSSLISGVTYGVTGATTVTNAGTIIASGTAGVGVASVTTLDNSGTIVGNSGTAVRFGNGTDLLIVESTGVFQGAIVGGSGSNTVDFAHSGSFSLSNIGGGTLVNFGTAETAAGVTLTNSGTGFTGKVVLGGSADTFNNLATGSIVTSSQNAVYGNTAATGATVTNAGTISSTATSGAGVYLRHGGLLTNTGTVAGAGFGVRILNQVGTVTNAGTIQGGTSTASTGVYLYQGSVVNQAINSLISGTSYGVHVHSGSSLSSVSNFGTIMATGTAGSAAGVSVYSGTITNNGTASLISGVRYGVKISNRYGSVPNVVSNSGTIVGTGTSGIGVVFSTGTDVLANSGTIIGNSGTAVQFGSGINLLQQGGVFVGEIVGGSGTNAVELTTSGALVMPTFAGTTLVNFNNIAAAAGVTLTNSGSFGNEVVLAGTGAALSNAAGALVVTSGRYAAYGLVAGVSVTNAGTIGSTNTAGAGIFLTSGGTIVNSGSIYGYRGVRSTGGIVSNNGSAAVISGTKSGIYLTGAGTITNSGTVTGQTYGVQLRSTTTVTNTGTITATGTQSNGAGIHWTSNGSLNNSGLISGNHYGVYNSSSRSTLVNTGILRATGTNGVGLELRNGGTAVSNQGTILGTAYGVRAGSTTSLTNSGTIQGAVGVAFVNNAGNVLDSTGTIIGNGGTAVQFGNGQNVLVLEPTGVFSGAIIGGTSGTNTVEFLQNGTLGLPTSVGGGTLQNFNGVGAGANVTLTNSGTSFGGQVLLGGTGATFINLATGSLSTTGRYAVYGSAAGVSLTNAGTIASTAGNGAGVYLSHGGSVSNSGTISGFFGVKSSRYDSGNSSPVQITNGGSAGVISGSRDGVYVYGNSYSTPRSVTNLNAGNVISGGSVGVYGKNGLSVTNAGTIRGGSAGIRIESGPETVVNSGTIIGTSGVGVALYGTSRGELNKLVNSGTIIGSAGTAVRFSDGTNLLVLQPGATFVGSVYGNPSGVNALEVTTNGTLAAPGSIVSGVTLVNFNSVGAAAGVTLTNSGTFGGGVILDGVGATLYNQSGGRIATSGNAPTVFANGSGSYLKNAGTIQSGSSYGAALSGGGSLNNLGSGTITGRGAVYGYGGAPTITNAGTLQGTSSYGIELRDLSSASIVNSGSIYGRESGVYLSGNSAASSATVTNSGTIIGKQRYGITARYAATTIANTTASSLISGYDDGISIENFATSATTAMVTNSGTIVGTGSSSSGIFLRGEAAGITNATGAVISGQHFGIESTGSGTLINALTINNTGTIIGAGTSGVGIEVVGSFANTLVNAGTIIGNSGTAVQFGNGNNLLAVDPGSKFVGVVQAGTGSSTVLFGTNRTVASLGIGSEYLNFAYVGIAAGATLTNTGTFTQSLQLSGASATLINAVGATLMSAGPAAVLGTVAGVSLSNAGLIQGGTAGLGVSLQAGGTVYNASTGTITGTSTGILVGGGTATITNHGTIIGSGTAGVGVLFASGATGTVDNFGTLIGGTSGNSVRFAGGTNELILETGSTLIGVADGSNGTNTLLIEGTGTLNNALVTGFTTVIFDNASGTISNSSTVTNANVTVGTLSNAGTLMGSVTVGSGTTLANSGVVNVGTSSTNSGYVSNGGTLTNSSTFSNAGSFANTGSLNNSGSLANGGSLNNSGSLTNTGSLANSGSLTNTGTITTTGSGTLSNTGSFTNMGAVMGSMNGITGGGTIANSGTIIGTSGTGVQLTSAGTVTNSAGGYIKGGQYGVVVGSGGTVTNAGTILDNITAGASLGSNATMSNASTGTVAGVTGVIFTGTGASFTNNGTITGSGGVAVQFDAGVNTLTLGTGSVLSGSIDGGSGAGLINLTGTGSLTNTIANFGTGSALTVASGADWTATGTWTIANVTNAGTFQAGDLSHSLNLTGNFTQASTGTLRVALDASGTGSFFNITGTAALAGSVTVVPSGTFLAASTPYTILTASGGVTGTFSGGVTTSSALLAPTLSYDAKDAIVTLAQLPVASPPTSPPVSPPVVSPPVSPPTSPPASPPVSPPTSPPVSPPTSPPVSPPTSPPVSPPVSPPTSPPVSPPAIVETANQHAVAVAFDAGLASNPTGFASAIRGLDQLNAAGVTSSLTRLSGESHASLATTALQTGTAFSGQFSTQAALARLGASGTASGQSAMEAGGRQELARLDGGTDDPIANIDKPWGVWTAGYGQEGQLAGDGNVHRLDETISGGSVGADYKLMPALKVGAGLGYGGTTYSLDDGGGRGQVDHTQFALYADYTMGPVYLDGTMGVAYGDSTTRRNVSLPGLPGQAQGHVTDTQLMGSLEAGYGLKLGPVTATPFAGLAIGSVDQDAFTETGAGVLDLHVAKQSQSSVKSSLGGRVTSDLALGSSLVTTDVSVAWAHEFAPTSRGVAAAFVGAPTAGFQVAGAKVPGDSALIGFGLATAVFANTSLDAHYDGDLAKGADSNAVTVGFRFAW